MYGKTKEQLKTRFKIAAVLGIISMIVFLIVQMKLHALTVWIFIAALILCPLAYTVEMFAFIVYPKVILEMIVEPFKACAGKSVILIPVVFAVKAAVMAFKPLIIGIKLTKYMLTTNDD